LTREILMEDDDEATNPTLSEEHLALLGARGEERVLANEELLYRPGEPYEHVYVVLDGEILILDGEREDARVIAELGRGKLLGEYGLLVGGMGLVTNVAGRGTRLLCLPIPMLLELVASDAVLSETFSPSASPQGRWAWCPVRQSCVQSSPSPGSAAVGTSFGPIVGIPLKRRQMSLSARTSSSTSAPATM
jgi:hypothetical protein